MSETARRAPPTVTLSTSATPDISTSSCGISFWRAITTAVVGIATLLHLRLQLPILLWAGSNLTTTRFYDCGWQRDGTAPPQYQRVLSNTSLHNKIQTRARVAQRTHVGPVPDSRKIASATALLPPRLRRLSGTEVQTQVCALCIAVTNPARLIRIIFSVPRCGPPNGFSRTQLEQFWVRAR